MSAKRKPVKWAILVALLILVPSAISTVSSFGNLQPVTVIASIEGPSSIQIGETSEWTVRYTNLGILPLQHPDCGFGIPRGVYNHEGARIRTDPGLAPGVYLDPCHQGWQGGWTTKSDSFSWNGTSYIQEKGEWPGNLTDVQPGIYHLRFTHVNLETSIQIEVVARNSTH